MYSFAFAPPNSSIVASDFSVYLASVDNFAAGKTWLRIDKKGGIPREFDSRLDRNIIWDAIAYN